MNWLFSNFSTAYLIQLVIGLIICYLVTSKIYKSLANYSGWQSHWKRILFISPVLIAVAFFVLIVGYSLSRH